MQLIFTSSINYKFINVLERINYDAKHYVNISFTNQKEIISMITKNDIIAKKDTSIII